MSRYNYQEIRARAGAPDATQADINELGEWFERYGGGSWNGEYYDADDGKRLFPVYQKIDVDEFELTGYEFR